MNIAYISCDFGVPVFGYKGASIHVREITSAFRKAGHHVHLISPAMHRGKEDENGSNMGEEGLQATAPFTRVTPPAEAGLDMPAETGQLFCLSVLPRPDDVRMIQALRHLDQFLDLNTRIRHEMRNLLYNVTLYNAVIDYLREQKIDFIYERYTLFSRAGIKLARTLGVPHILEVNAPLAYEQEKMRGLDLKRLAKNMEKRIYQESDHVMVVSNELKEFVQMCGVLASRVTVLPNAVNPARFQIHADPQPVRRKYKLREKIVVGFVGSLKAWHGTITLLQAFNILYPDIPNLHLLIVGDGPERPTLEAFVEKNHLTSAVTFTGKVPHDEIPKYIAAMDIAVAPYIPNENFYFSPIKIFEYMVMGKPTVGAKIGQVREVVRHRETGWLFEPGNINQLVHALTTLSRDQRLRETLGKSAQNWVLQERTWDNNARIIINMAKELM